jgi:hypothetical protein
MTAKIAPITIGTNSIAAGEIRKRAADPATYCERCLERYFWLVDYERGRLRLSQDEATLVCEALRDAEHAFPGLWSVAKRVADNIRERERDAKEKIDGFDLVNKIRGMTPGQIIALADAVDRFWQLSGGDVQERLKRVGLLQQSN